MSTMLYTDLFKEPIQENGTSLARIGENGKTFFTQLYKLGNLYPEADIRIEKDKLHFGNPNNMFICILFNDYLEVYVSLLTYQILVEYNK